MRDFIHIICCSPFDDRDLLIPYFLVSRFSRLFLSQTEKYRESRIFVVGWERRKSGARSIKTACQQPLARSHRRTEHRVPRLRVSKARAAVLSMRTFHLFELVSLSVRSFRNYFLKFSRGQSSLFHTDKIIKNTWRHSDYFGSHKILNKII